MKTQSKFIFLIVVLIYAVALLGSAFAWLYIPPNYKVDTYISQATVLRQYFHCGEGTASKPFVITRPIHYYHLVELYQRNSTFSESNYYFQVGYDFLEDGNYYVYDYDNYGNTDGTLSTTLNMAYYSGALSVIPIGTSTVPFIGHFDGKNLKIKNLSIISSETITTSKGTVTYATSDVGIFGYVSPSATIQNTYFEDVTISLVGATADAKHQASSQTGQHQGDTVYIGYVVGHLYSYTNAEGIVYSEGSVTENANPLSNIYVNNVTIVGGCADTATSGYGYIGYIDQLDGKTAMSLIQMLSEIAEAGQGDEGWGGSIDMTSLYNRIDDYEEMAQDRKYIQNETITAASTASGTPEVSYNSKSSGNISSRSDIVYWSALTNAGQGQNVDMTGGAFIGSQTDTWNYLYGLSSSQLTTTTTYTKTGAEVLAYYIYDNGCYLTYDGLNFTKETTSKNASKWIPENTTNESYFYTLINNTKYYLAISNSNTLEITSTPTTIWNLSDDHEFYTTKNNTEYYLYYNGSWILTETMERYVISDGTNYLSATTTAIINETNENDGAIWKLTNPSGNTKFYFEANGSNYYLSYNAGLTITQDSNNTWYREVDGTGKVHYYYLANGIRYYLIYDNGWKALMTGGFKIHSDTHYLGVDTSTTPYSLYDTSSSNATLFQIASSSGNYTIVASINGVGQYLTNDGTSLKLSSTASYWKKDSSNRYYKTMTISGQSINYYLVYSNGWKLDIESGYKITDGDGHYLTATTAQTITNANLDNSTTWVLTPSASSTEIFTLNGQNVQYLTISSVGLGLSTNSTTWYKDTSNNGYYTTRSADSTSVVDNLYIAYDNAWIAKSKYGQKISDGYGHYLSYRNNAIISTSALDACDWQINFVSGTNTCYIYTLIGTTRNYLGLSSGTLARTTSPTLWTHTTANASHQFYFYDSSEQTNNYLYYDSATDSWKLIVIDNIMKISYTSSSTSNSVYLHSTGVGLTSGTQANSANWTRIGADNSFTYYTFINSVKYYLTYEVKLIKQYDQNETLIGAYQKIVPTVSTTRPTATWGTEGTGTSLQYYMTIASVKHYLVFNFTTGEWEFEVRDGSNISDGNGNYLDVTNIEIVGDDVTIVTPTFTKSTNGDYKFHKETISSGKYRIFVVVGDTKYYVCHSTSRDTLMTLSLSTNSSGSEYRIDPTLRYNSYNINFVLTYNNGSWFMFPQNLREVKATFNSTTYYLTYDNGQTNLQTTTMGSNPYQFYRWNISSDSSGYTIATSNATASKRYYLVCDSTGTLKLELNNTTFKWQKDGNSYYAVIGGTNYYLQYSSTQSKFVAEPTQYHYIYQDSTHYLAANGTTGVKADSSASTTNRWYSINLGSGQYIFYNSTGYLDYDLVNSFHFETSSANVQNAVHCTITTSGISTNNFYWTINGTNFYLYFDSSASCWSVTLAKSLYKFSTLERGGTTGTTVNKSSGQVINHYLSFNTSTLQLSDTTTEASATLWTLPTTYHSEDYVCTIYNGKCYFLNFDGTNLSVINTNSPQKWTNASPNTSEFVNYNFETLGVNYSSSMYYIYYNSKTAKWSASKANRYTIASTTTNYYATVGSTSSFANSTSIFTTTSSQKHLNFSNTNWRWEFSNYTSLNPSGTIMARYSGTKCYTKTNNGFTTSASSAASWTNTNGVLNSGSYKWTLSSTTWSTKSTGTGTTFAITPVEYNDGSYSFIFETCAKLNSTTSAPQMNIKSEGSTTKPEITISNSLSFTTYATVNDKSVSASGYFGETQVEGLQANVSYVTTTYTVATTSVYTRTLYPTQEEITIIPPEINIRQVLSNPTISPTQTTDRLYVATTTTYKRGTYLPLQLETTESGEYYSDYRASYKNTGYIVGGTYSSASGSGIGDIRVSGYSIRNIGNSYNRSTQRFTTLYTFNDTGSSPVAINDSVNSYIYYESTKQNFLNTLKQDNSAVYGLHFMESEISTSKTISAEAVKIQNKTFVNYELPESSIDFNVYAQGYIILYAGDYYTSGNSCFFSLHKIFRDANNHITSIKEISEIYTKPGLTTRDNFIYKFTDNTYTNANGTYTGATTLDANYNSNPVFKMKWLTNPTNGRDFENNYIYYFEIPCNKGEFALGSVGGQTGGYLLYLDIAANGTQARTYNQEAAIGSAPLFTQIDYRSSGTVLNSRLHYSYVVPTNNTSENFSISVSYNPNEVVYDPKYNVDCTVYTITITNQTNNPMDLTILLIDDDDDPDNVYTYRYRIYYNGTEYTAGTSYDTTIGAYYVSATYNLPKN